MVCTDPSGYFSLKGFFRAAVVIAAAYYTGGAAINAYAASTAAATGAAVGSAAYTAAAASTTAGIIGGAAGGFTGGLLASNGDFNAALKGAVTGGIFGGLDAYASINKFSSFQTAAANALTGGASAKMQGGSFAEGFMNSGLSTGASEAYKYMVGRSPDPLPGENRPDQTTYTPDPRTGRQPLDSVTMNVVGDNNLASFCRQGSTCSKLLNLVPGINATAGLHDYWFNTPNAPQQTLLTNWGTMIPAAAITYTGLLRGSLSVQLAAPAKQ